MQITLKQAIITQKVAADQRKFQGRMFLTLAGETFGVMRISMDNCDKFGVADLPMIPFDMTIDIIFGEYSGNMNARAELLDMKDPYGFMQNLQQVNGQGKPAKTPPAGG